MDQDIFVTDTGLDSSIINPFVYNLRIMTPKKSRMIMEFKIKQIFAFQMTDIRLISFYFGLKME